MLLSSTRLWFWTSSRRSNERAGGKGRIASLFHAAHPWPALPQHERCMFTRLQFGLTVMAAVALTVSCKPSSPPAATAPPLAQGGEIENTVFVQLPETASPEHVVSNLFRESMLLDGRPILVPKAVMLNSKGTVVAHSELQGQRVTNYHILDMRWVIYDHGAEKLADVDTDSGRKFVFMAYDPAPRGSRPAGWWCRVEVPRPFAVPDPSVQKPTPLPVLTLLQ